MESGSIADGSVLEITSQNSGLTFQAIQSGEAVVHYSMGKEDRKTLPYKVQALTMHGHDDVTDTSVAMVTLPAVGPYAKIEFNLLLHAALEKQSGQEEATEYKVWACKSMLITQLELLFVSYNVSLSLNIK